MSMTMKMRKFLGDREKTLIGVAALCLLVSGLLTASAFAAVPTDITLSPSKVMSTTDTSAGTLIGLLATIDADAGDTHSYLIVGTGADDAVFSIIGGNQLQLTDGVIDIALPTDGNADGVYEVRVETTDGTSNTFEKTLLVNVVPVYNSLIHSSLSTDSTKWAGSGGWGINGGKYGEFTCGTCHAPNTGNIKRIKTSFAAPNGTDQFPIEAGAGTISFQDVRAGSSDFGDDSRADKTQSTNACEACHTYDPSQINGVKYHGYDMTVGGDSGHYNLADCMICHPHGQGFKPQACDSCHGYPPIDASSGGTTGLANLPYATGSTTAGAHTAHAVNLGLGCTNCHDGYTMPKESAVKSGFGDISISFNNYGSTTGSYAGQAGVSYNDTLGSGTENCSNVYCHSTGQSADGASATPSTYSTPSWSTPLSGACGTCHSDIDPATGSHTIHIGTGAVCNDCHSGNNHVDRNVDVTAGTYTAGGAPGNNYGSCSTASCHDSVQGEGAVAGGTVVTPIWGTPTVCGECHLAVPVTGSHNEHLAASGVSCESCHTTAGDGSVVPTANHVDTNIDVANGYPLVNPIADNTYSTCNAASCHNTVQGEGAVAGTVIATPAWGTATACGECHVAVPVTGSHNEHLAASGVSCESCHTTAGDGSVMPTANHVDTNIDVANGYPAVNPLADNTYSTCNAAACHNTVQGEGAVAGTAVVTPAWGTATACGECHLAVPVTGSHNEHLLVAGVTCADCHATAGDGSVAPTANHVDSNIDVVNGYPAVNPIADNTYSTCNTASCHDSVQGEGAVAGSTVVTPAWGTATACGECHLAVPVTGSHNEHLAASGVSCESCHTTAGDGSVVPTANHVDTNIDVANGYPLVNPIADNTYSTCSTAACHTTVQGEGAVAGTVIATPAWGTATACGECHVAVPVTGSHNEHLAASGVTCESCHTTAGDGSVVPTANHVDTNIDVANGYPLVNPIADNTYSTCNAASCHNTVQGEGAVAGTAVVTPAWGTVTACGECHLAVPVTGSHNEHLAASGVTCESCHTTAGDGSLMPTANHVDTNIDVANGYPAVNPIADNTYSTCNAAACHNTVQGEGAVAGTAVVTPAWGTATACGECHLAVPVTGSHGTHIAVAGVTCADCHATAGDGSVVPTANHVDSNIDVINGYPAVNPIADSTYSSCGTNNCHGSGTPTWGTDLSANDQCTQCHGELVAGPASDAQKAPGGAGVDTNGDSLATDAQVGAHQVHLNPSISAPIACSSCHVVPGTITAAGHIDSALPAELTFSGLALGGLDGQAAVAPAGCATTYCHDGAAIKNGWDGGTLAPTWTDTNFVQGAAADCDNCHGYPPAGGHIANSDCSVCHDVVNADDVTFTAAGKLTHVDGIVQASGGDSCTDCHTADIDGVKTGVHGSHTDTATFLAGKTISGGNYGGAGWYATTYVGGKPNFGCGECHPANEGVSHPTAGLNIDLDPAGETPTAGSLKLKNTDAPSNPTYVSGSSVTCSNVYCHSDAGATPTYATTQDWYGGTVSGNCNDCHANGPSSGTHDNHLVGIHYETLYDGASGLMATSGASGAAHGDPLTADTIGCQSCHNDTVAVEFNDQNAVCNTCHSASPQGNMTINAAGATHVNGQADVVFDTFASFKSKAQLRDDITTVTELNNNWTRTNGYKAAGSFDQGKAAVPGYAAGSCSNIACHNGIATPTWNTGFNGNCRACHTSLP